MDKTRDSKSDRSTRLRKGSRTEARSLATIEIHLEATNVPDEESLEPLLDRSEVRRVANDDLSERLTPKGGDEWIDSESDAHVLVGHDRLLVRLTLPDESRDRLAQRLDRMFDLAFELSSALQLEVVDPQVGSVVSRFRYEQQFQRFLNVYYTRARTAAALDSTVGWTDLGEGIEFRAADPLPAIETEPDALPPAIWGTGKRPLGVLEFSGERALAALQHLNPEAPFVAIVPLSAESGDDAAVLRVRRWIRPIAELALVEVTTEGVLRVHAMDRKIGRLTLVPRER